MMPAEILCTLAPIGPQHVQCTLCGRTLDARNADAAVRCRANGPRAEIRRTDNLVRQQSARPPQPAPQAFIEFTPDELPCVYRGKEGRPHETGCDLCGIRGQPLTIYDCAKHGQCSMHRKHSAVKACVGCAEMEAGVPASAGTEAEGAPAPLAPHPSPLTPPAQRPARVSIIIAARNNAPFLREALDSAFQQFPSGHEVIYSDDASTDDSVAIAREYPDVAVLTCSTHRGVCAARNAGAAASHGDYLIFLDGDDNLPSDFVRKHLDAMHAGEAAGDRPPFVYGPAQAFGDDNTLWPAPDWTRYDRWQQNTVNTSAMYARWAFEAAGRWREGAGSMWDYDLALRAARLGTPRRSDATIHYRQHEASWSSVTNERAPNRWPEIATRIRRLNARVSIGCLYSGRLPALFPAWLDAVKTAVARMHLPEPPELVILDNAGVPPSGGLLATAQDHFTAPRILRHRDRVTWQTEQQRRDNVARFMAAGMQRLRAELHGDLHWIIEDDVLVPAHAGELLHKALTSGSRPPQAVAGWYRNRHQPEKLLADYWTEQGPQSLLRIPDAPELLPIDLTGTGCLMFWRDRTPAIWRSHARGIAAHDWAWCDDVHAAGGQVLLHAEVRCGHAQTADKILEC